MMGKGRKILPWQHDHVFGQDEVKSGERRTIIVIVITTAMMVVEVAAGIAFGSMALLADGLHMASHAAALGIAAFAYVFARRHARDDRFSFGTGKVNALGGFTGAVLLGAFAMVMAWESLERFVHPVTIRFDQAIGVAVLGFIVNGASMLILGDHFGQDHSERAPVTHHGDHNLRAAYLHVLADALTSLLAIVALVSGKYFGAEWLDPLMGVVGAGLVGHWSWGLLRRSGGVLLDRQGPARMRRAVIEAIEEQVDGKITDLHLWSIGPGIFAAEIALVSAAPRSPDHYKELLDGSLGIVHITIEVHQAESAGGKFGD